MTGMQLRYFTPSAVVDGKMAGNGPKIESLRGQERFCLENSLSVKGYR